MFAKLSENKQNNKGKRINKFKENVQSSISPNFKKMMKKWGFYKKKKKLKKRKKISKTLIKLGINN